MFVTLYQILAVRYSLRHNVCVTEVPADAGKSGECASIPWKRLLHSNISVTTAERELYAWYATAITHVQLYCRSLT